MQVVSRSIPAPRRSSLGPPRAGGGPERLPHGEPSVVQRMEESPEVQGHTSTDSLEEIYGPEAIYSLGAGDDDELIWSEIDDSQNHSLQETQQKESEPVTKGSKSWHSSETVLHRVLSILQLRQIPPNMIIFPSTPDYKALERYFIEKNDPKDAFYVVNRTEQDRTVFAQLVASKPKLGDDWGSTITKQPRYHLVAERWVANGGRHRPAPPPLSSAVRRLQKLHEEAGAAL